MFIRERIWRSNPGSDLMDPTAPPESLTIDAATIYLMSWAYIRPVMYQLAISGDAAANLHLASLARRPAFPSATQETGTCKAAYLGSSNESAVLQVLAEKVFNGLELPQIGTFKELPKIDGVFGRMFNDLFPERGPQALDQLAPADRAAIAGKILARINDLGKVLSLVDQVTALELVVISPEPLERTRDKTPGEKRSIQFRLSFNPEKLKNDKRFDCFLRVVGFPVGYKLPEAEPIAGAVVAVEQGHNMPAKVFVTGNSNPASSSWGGGYEYHTDSSGLITVQFMGSAQARKIPDSVGAYDDTYSVRIRAQPQPVTGLSLVDQFMGGLMAPGGAGLFGALVNTAGKMTYDMGEYELPLVDWGYPAYRASGPVQGVVCRDSTSTLTAEGGQILTLYPGAWPRGQYSYSYRDADGCTISGEGSYEVQLDEAELHGRVVLEGNETLTCPELGSISVPEGAPFEVTAESDAACGK
jgi:hypothetical protein